MGQDDKRNAVNGSPMQKSRSWQPRTKRNYHKLFFCLLMWSVYSDSSKQIYVHNNCLISAGLLYHSRVPTWKFKLAQSHHQARLSITTILKSEYSPTGGLVMRGDCCYFNMPIQSNPRCTGVHSRIWWWHYHLMLLMQVVNLICNS